MFQVQKEQYVNKTFRFRKELIEELKELANEEEISMNELVAQCCAYALENREKDSD